MIIEKAYFYDVMVPVPQTTLISRNDNNSDGVSNYQDEMCERLIQMSFAKIVNSKNERGGARLRKNLLILHLLQKARTEQRTRVHVESTPTVIDEGCDPHDTLNRHNSMIHDDDDDDFIININGDSVVDDNDVGGTFLDDRIDDDDNASTTIVEEFLPMYYERSLMTLDEPLGNRESSVTLEPVSPSLESYENAQGNAIIEDNTVLRSNFFSNTVAATTTTTAADTTSKKRKPSNSSDEETSSDDTDDSDGTCSDDDAASPPCVQCSKRKRKLTESDNGSIPALSNKRCCPAAADQLQGLITVFQNGLSGMNALDVTVTSDDDVENGSEGTSNNGNGNSGVNTNGSLSRPTVWELTCVS